MAAGQPRLRRHDPDLGPGTRHRDIPPRHLPEPHDGGTWICRRDPSIQPPCQQVIATTPDGIPYLAPQIVLLFKARHHRPKDLADFTGVLPLLNPARRAWLATALACVHPGHPWISELQGRP